MPTSTWLNDNPVAVLLLAFTAVLLAVTVGPPLLAAARRSLAPPPARPSPAAEPPPLVPIYRVAPTGIAAAPTEDLTDAITQMRQEFLRREELALTRQDTYRRLLAPAPAAPPASPLSADALLKRPAAG